MPQVTVVAQTPFQLFGALLIARLSDRPCDLWLIDPTLSRYLEPCRSSGIWREVHYAEKNGGDLWSTGMAARWRKFATFRRSVGDIRRYLRRERPEAIFLFSDNHELTAFFAEQGSRRPPVHVVLVEEGVTVHFPPDYHGAPLWIGLCRRALGIPNPWGKSIGWSPGIAKLVLSDPATAHPDYLAGRPCAPWPAGPYPDRAVREFAALAGVDGTILPPPGEVRTVLLGTPFSEYGMFSAEEERSMVLAIDEASDGATWIKPHPFDTPGKYRFCSRSRLFPEELSPVPAEILLHLLRPRLVVSYFCSAAFNYCLRYRGRALFFLPPNAPPILRQIMEQHFLEIPWLRLVDDLTEIPAAMAELLALPDPPEPSAADLERWRGTVADAMRPAHARRHRHGGADGANNRREKG